jgi:hypothetical protein
VIPCQPESGRPDMIEDDLPEEDLANEDLANEDLPDDDLPHDLPEDALPEDLPAPEPFDTPASRYIIRNIDGLRVTLAGFPPQMGVVIGKDCAIEANTVAELRAIGQVPHALEILIPYRVMPDTLIRVNRLGPEWDRTER